MNINLDKIKIDGGTQSRAKIDQDVIAEYSDLIKGGTVFPAVVLFHDGAEYFLADGFHRYFATRKAGAPGILAEIKEGTLRDAILYSFGANHNHGLRRTNADKRKAVVTMIMDIEWQDWSDREIAKACHVSNMLVASIRKNLGVLKTETTFTRGGKEIVQSEKPKRKEPEETYDKDAIAKEIQKAASDNLQKENEDLRDQLAIVQSISSDELQREKAESVIKDLRAQIRLLEIDLKAVTTSRDQFQRENAQLMKQVAMLQKNLKKLEA